MLKTKVALTNTPAALGSPLTLQKEKSSMKYRYKARATAIIASSALLLAGCGADEGGGVGFNEFTRASAAEMPNICEMFFGDADSVGSRFDTTVFESEHVHECTYETSGGEWIGLGISDSKPEAPSVGRGENYYAYAYYSMDLEPDVLETIGSWLERRASAIEDDFEDWIAELPHAEEALVSSEGSFAYDESTKTTSLSGTLLTPASRVSVSGVSKPTFVSLDDEPTQPAEGQQFLNVSVSISALSIEGAPKAVYHAEIAGEKFEEATEALDRVVAGAASELLLSVPVDANEVDLVATVNDETQRISLITGVVDDEGRSERLASAKQGSLEFIRTRPEVTDEDDYSRWVGYSDPYDDYATWSSTPYSDTEGWAKADEHFLVIGLVPDTPESAHELTTADAVLDINGQDYKATSYDPATHSLIFSIPSTTSRAKVTYQATLDTSLMGSWESGYKMDGPEKNVGSIDFHSSGSSIYPSDMTDGSDDSYDDDYSDDYSDDEDNSSDW